MRLLTCLARRKKKVEGRLRCKRRVSNERVSVIRPRETFKAFLTCARLGGAPQRARGDAASPPPHTHAPSTLPRPRALRGAAAMADAATDVHSYTGYNKYQNQSTLVGNWVEERALKAATGTHRYKVRRRRWRLAGRVRGQGGGLRARAGQRERQRQYPRRHQRRTREKGEKRLAHSSTRAVPRAEAALLEHARFGGSRASAALSLSHVPVLTSVAARLSPPSPLRHGWTPRSRSRCIRRRHIVTETRRRRE